MKNLQFIECARTVLMRKREILATEQLDEARDKLRAWRDRQRLPDHYWQARHQAALKARAAQALVDALEEDE